MPIKRLRPNPPERMFIGHIDPSRWVLLNDRERAGEAERIRQQLSHRDIRAAIIYNNGVTAISIMEGELRFIE